MDIRFDKVNESLVIVRRCDNGMVVGCVAQVDMTVTGQMFMNHERTWTKQEHGFEMALAWCRGIADASEAR